MKIKTYKDGTYNLYFEVGDHVKIKTNDKFGKPSSKDGTWGKVTKTSGKKVSKVEFKDKDGEKHEEFVWSLIPVDEKGTKIPEDQLFKLTPVKESRLIKKFSEFISS
jgi:hypothetical protein